MSDRRASQRSVGSSRVLQHEVHDEPKAPASVRAQSAVVRTATIGGWRKIHGNCSSPAAQS